MLTDRQEQAMLAMPLDGHKKASAYIQTDTNLNRVVASYLVDHGLLESKGNGWYALTVEGLEWKMAHT